MPEGASKHIKVWKATNKSNAGFMVTEKAAVMAGDKSNFIVASGGTGVAISGKSISFMTTSENQRHGGLFIKMNDLVQMVPKTIVTPMPSQIPFPPFGLVGSVIKDLPFFLAMLV